MQRRSVMRALVVGLMGAVLLSALQTPQLAWAAVTTPDLPWWTLDAGGGTSTGSTYRLSGTFGQPDAGPGGVGMSGGGTTLTGGFWPGATIPRYALHLPLVLRE